MAIKQRRRRGVVGIARSNRVGKGSVVIDCIVLTGDAQKKRPPGKRRAGVGNDKRCLHRVHHAGAIGQGDIELAQVAAQGSTFGGFVHHIGCG